MLLNKSVNGTLYVCATPIGNLDDITLRALKVLSQADVIVCEDTRVSLKLLNHHSIPIKKIVSLNAHNENQITSQVLTWLSQNLIVVQISDAGTPSISDPGARLCRQVLQSGFTLSPIPGACAFISLVSVAGLAEMNGLFFYGFLPSTKDARRKVLQTFLHKDYSIIWYEAPHRIIKSLEDVADIFGKNQKIIFGRELTKQFETIKNLTVEELLEFIKNDSNQQRGEIVLILPVQKVSKSHNLTHQQINALNLLANEVAPKKAIKITQQLFEGNSELMYEYLLQNKHKE